MSLIIRTKTKKSVCFSELFLTITPQNPVYVEDGVLEYKEIISALNKNQIEIEHFDPNQTLPIGVENCYMADGRRQKLITEKVKEREDYITKMKSEEMVQKKLDNYYSKCGVLKERLSKGVGFSSDASVKCVFGYGIALFDGDMPNRDNETCHDYLYEIADSDSFRNFSADNGVFVTEWKEEDCRQVLLADAETYREETMSSFFDLPHDLKSMDKRVNDVWKEFKRISKDEYGVKGIFGVYIPQWFLHLYYD